MRVKKNICLCIAGLFFAILGSNCTTYNLSLKNTLSIFLLHNEKDFYFCIPVQYIGEYQISRFEFTNGNILIGDFDILLKRDDVIISVYLNETADENGNTVGEFNLIYQEINGRVLVSKMAEPLAAKNETDYMMNQYSIFIERHLTDNEMKHLLAEYKRGNTYSKMSVWYDITIDNEEQNGSGMLDDFELYSGESFNEYVWLFPNLEFFRTQYNYGR